MVAPGASLPSLILTWTRRWLKGLWLSFDCFFSSWEAVLKLLMCLVTSGLISVHHLQQMPADSGPLYHVPVTFPQARYCDQRLISCSLHWFNCFLEIPLFEKGIKEAMWSIFSLPRRLVPSKLVGLISAANRVSDAGCEVMFVENEMRLDFQRVSKNMALWPNLLLNTESKQEV